VPVADTTASERADGASGQPRQELGQAGRRVLQAIYDLLRDRSAWPSFRTVDLRFDRDMGIADAQAALAAIPAAYLQRPWHASGFYDNDEVRLSLRGVRECEGGPDDLDLLVRLVQWLCEVERSQDSDETDPRAESVDFAASLGLSVEDAHPEGVEADRPESDSGDEISHAAADLPPTDVEAGSADAAEATSALDEEAPVSAEVARNRATLARLYVLADLLVPHFWSGAGWPSKEQEWRWYYTLDRRRLRPYRDIHDVDQLLDYADQQRESLARERVSARFGWNVQSEDSAGFSEAEQVEEPGLESDELDVLLTILRQEIIDAAAAQLRGGLFDDAIFAAYRRVEAAVQQRSGLTGTIGSQLVEQAFRGKSDPIRVSTRSQDAERLIQLFDGALGLYKGDRSHKDKPALPCRSLRECLRQLANASSLLDLLDRDIAIAPSVHGYDQRGDMLELWTERASVQSQVWLDDRLCEVIRHSPSSLILDVAGVPPGEHELFIVDGSRTGPVTQIWLTRNPGAAGWWRVSEVSIPLFAAQTGPERMEETGLRLTVQEHRVIKERIVATTGTYRVGDYVNPKFDVGTGPGFAWIGEGTDESRRQVWLGRRLLVDEPYGRPAYEPRLMKITLEPPSLLLRPEERAPIRILGHYTDGVATWPEPLEGCDVTPDEPGIVHVERGTVFAKGYGKATLRLVRNGLYAAGTVHVAAHPTGTMTDVLTGLPPVAGIAWAANALVVSMRTEELWRLGADGRFVLATAVPLQPPDYDGTDTIAAAENGDLAVRLDGYRDVLVLDKASGYRKSRWVSSGERNSVQAMIWDGDDLILALHTGSIRRTRPDGGSEQIAMFPHGPIASIAHTGDALLALTRGDKTQLWRIALSQDGGMTSILPDKETLTADVVAYLNGSVYLTGLNSDRILRLEGQQVIEVASGLSNPRELAGGPDGSIYIAEFGRGAVRRLLP
jgi:hypothetical protein